MDVVPADYAVVWQPPAAMLAGHRPEGLFNLGAGVDAIMRWATRCRRGVPVVRLDDAGMAVQMAEYVSHAVLRHFRRFDDYALQAQQAAMALPETATTSADFARRHHSAWACWAAASRRRCAQFGFPLHGWSRSAQGLAGRDLPCRRRRTGRLSARHPGAGLHAAADRRNRDILNRATLEKLPQGAYLINVARGGHLVEEDLLALVDSRPSRRRHAGRVPQRAAAAGAPVLAGAAHHHHAAHRGA